MKEDAEDTRVRRDGKSLRTLLESQAATLQTWLLVQHRASATLHVLPDGGEIVIGRQRGASLRLDDPTLSRLHAKLTRIGDDVWAEDLGSSNGTLLNGERIEGRVSLRPLDELSVGDVVVRLHSARASWSKWTGTESHDRFLLHLQEEVVRCRSLGRSSGLVLIRAGEPGEAFLTSSCPRIRELLGPADHIALYSPTILEVLRPEANRANLEEFVTQVRDAREGEPQLLVGAACIPGAGATAAAVTDAAREAMLRASSEEPVVWVGSVSATSYGPGPASAPVVANGPGMRAVLEQVDRVARSRAPVLVQGETGVGKEVIARLLHDRSDRRGPLVALNCGAIAEQLVEGTLFGHERGAFTGADRRRQGVFESADGGTLFLDEIGELSPGAQAALLRALDTKRIRRVGATEEIPVDVRVVVATHRDLMAMTREGTFRRDLLYRLNTVIVDVPPLRERREDVAELAETFLSEVADAYGSMARRFSAAALQALLSHNWPGNVRELRNTVEHAALNARGPFIEPRDLGPRLEPVDEITAVAPAHLFNPTLTPRAPFKDLVREYERELMLRALIDTGWNKTAAARRLQMPLRTFTHKYVAYDLDALAPRE